MKRQEIRKTFESLAMSQGFYGRLLRDLDNADTVQQNEFWDELEGQNFRDPVDLVMYLEC